MACSTKSGSTMSSTCGTRGPTEDLVRRLQTKGGPRRSPKSPMRDKVEKVAVYGAGGHGKVVADVARSVGRGLTVFIDDDPRRTGELVAGIQVVSWEGFLREFEQSEVELAMGIGDNRARERTFDL